MPIKFKTSDLLYWQAVIAVIIMQFILCYDAMICRGYPSMTEMAFNKMLASPLLVWVPAVFGSRVNRMRGIMVMSVSLTIFLTMVYVNGEIRPSIGSLSGPLGILGAYFIQIIFSTILVSPITFVALYYFERVTGDIWRLIFFRRTERLTFSETWNRVWSRTQSSIPT